MAEDKKKILIVDDEQDLREMFKDILQTAGFEVGEAENGLVALEELEKGQYDLVLLDLMMPKMDGMEALGKIRENTDKYGKMPVLILTNLTSDIAIKEGFERKADGYLIKTELTPEQIIEEVKRFISNGK